MTTFEDLPLELRSMILQEWLDGLFKRHQMSTGLHWDHFVIRWRSSNHSYRTYAEARRTITSRRDAAATTIKDVFDAFPAGSPTILEFARLINNDLARLQDKGRAACAQAEALRSAYWRPGNTLQESMDAVMNWSACLAEISILEWSCNTLEMGLGVEKSQWTRFQVHDIASDARNPVTLSVLDTAMRSSVLLEGELLDR